SNIILAIGLVTVLATLLIPLPTALLDILLAGSISLSVAVLIITLTSKEALELSTFPSLLLFVTLYRLSINVASTRLILLQCNAGKIIQTFGMFVAGGSAEFFVKLLQAYFQLMGQFNFMVAMPFQVTFKSLHHLIPANFKINVPQIFYAFSIFI
ncbi:MAG: FHIPEP family type III secretion protein, partial [Chloroflexi bacterium]|nr:FHIPEP family type III secretion protein [Chloroflexota bacterium]